MTRLGIGSLAAALLATALIAIACDGDGSGGGEPSATAPETATTSGPTGVPFEGGREPVEQQVPEPQVAFLRDVRTEGQDGFDRVVFEFEGGSTGYRVQYVEPPIVEDPSGLPVEVAGNAFLQVIFFSASGVDLSGLTPRITCCAGEITAGLPSLVDLKKTGDFEATLSWVLGLAAEVDFRVSELPDPYRIVIDVAHPPAGTPAAGQQSGPLQY